MSKINRKQGLSIMLALTMLFGVCIAAKAEDNFEVTRNSLQSKGIIQYQEGTESVLIDSEDLYKLADRLDMFKLRVTEQLGKVGTYFSRDSAGMPLNSGSGVYVVHQEPVFAEVDPVTLSFETIFEGIAASQTIPTDPAAYGAKAEIDEQGAAKEISIRAATVENLSEGTAAWENGNLLLGTGGDNKAHYQQGYLDGLQEATENTAIQYVYHSHSNDCYTGYHEHTESCSKKSCHGAFDCTSHGLYYDGPIAFCRYTCINGHNTGPMRHGSGSSCGASVYTCGDSPDNQQRLSCGKSESTIESAVITFK